MNNMFSKSAIWVVVALLLFMLFKQFDNHSVAGGSKTIAYSELLDDVKARRVKDVVIEGANITATRTDDTKVRATATMLGLTLETVSRSLTAFRKRGWIREPVHHRVELLNVPAITAMAEGTGDSV